MQCLNSHNVFRAFKENDKSFYSLDFVVRHVEVVEGDGWGGDLLEQVVGQEDAADAHQAPEGAPLHRVDPVVGQIHVQKSWNLAESEGFDLLEMIVTEVEMSDAEQSREDTPANVTEVVVCCIQSD